MDEKEQVTPMDGQTKALPEIPSDLTADTVSCDTVRVELPDSEPQVAVSSDTRRIDHISQVTDKETAPHKEIVEHESDYVPPSPIVFKPKSRLRELKRKLVAGPEKRYYELSEQGFGKLQAAIFLSFLVLVATAGSTVLYALGKVPQDRLKLMIFGQFLAMMVSALLGSFQLIEGVVDIFRGRFSFNTTLVITFLVCCVDSIYCLDELRVPCCAAFSLQIMMSLRSTYHRRSAELGQMDTMRKAVRLHSLVKEPDFFDGSSGILRSEGEVEDFMDSYQKLSAQERVLSVYAVLATLGCAACGIVAGKLHGSVSFGIQVTAVSLLAAVPVAGFVAISRPMAILQKRLHKVGTVLCGWRGIKGLCGRAVFPLSHEDLFPAGSCRMNGVKFYGDREPDQVVAYTAAVIAADGGGLTPLFNRLLESRSGEHYDVWNLRSYGNGGLGGEVCGEPVLVGVPSFLKDMGVEIPEGTRVNQAVYVAIDGELCGLFAVSYAAEKTAARGLHTLCAYRKLRPVMTTGDFMLTESFIRSKFGVNTRKIAFPEREVREELAQRVANPEAPGLALVTEEGLSSFAYAVTGARSLNSAWTVGTVIELLGGLLGIAIMAVLAVLGARELLTPVNVLLYELVWLIPGMLVTEWTRAV